MFTNYGVRLTIKSPIKIFREAAENGWIKILAPGVLSLRTKLLKEHGWLQELEVVHSAAAEHVSYRGAAVLKKLVTQITREEKGKDSVHIGWVGGALTCGTARDFVQLLCEEPGEDLPGKIYIHNMIASVNPQDPTLDPGFTVLQQVQGRWETPVQFEFVQFPGAALIDTTAVDFPGLRAAPAILDVVKQAEKLDIVVTSAGGWNHGHSIFQRLMSTSARSCRQLEAAGVQGDMGFCPIGKSGPIDTPTELQFWTLMELAQLPGFIAGGGKVVLLMAPCSHCLKPNLDVMRALFGHAERLFTPLIVDSYTARCA